MMRTHSCSYGRKLLIEIVGKTHQTTRANARSPMASRTQRLKITLKIAPMTFMASGAAPAAMRARPALRRGREA